MTVRTGRESRAIAILPPLASPLGRLLGEGKAARVYAVGAERVAKVFGDHWPWRAVTDEWAASRSAWSHGIATPRPHALLNANGQPAIVFERVDGPPLASVLQQQPWSFRRYMAALAQLQHSVHAQPATALRPQAKMLSFSIGQLEGESDAQINEWTLALQRLGGTSLCHNDFHAENVLVRDGKLIVIDWGKGAVGSGVLDAVLAYLKLRNGAGSAPLTQWIIAELAECFARHYRRVACVGRADFERLVPVAEASLRRDKEGRDKEGPDKEAR